jgi:hypothetical protein
MKAIATLIAATVAVFLLGTGVAKADCYTNCYDGGDNGYQCDTTCDDD